MIKETTVYNLSTFMQGAKQHPQYPNAVSMMESGMKFTHDGITCKVFNPRLALLFMQKTITGNRLTITTHEDLTDTRELQKDIEIEVLPLLEAYHSGYQEGEREIMQAHPNPPATAGFLVEYFNKHLRRVPLHYPTRTSIEGIAEIGRKAGQFGAMDRMEVLYPGLLKAIGKQRKNSDEKVLPDLKTIIERKYFQTMIERLKSNGDIIPSRVTGQYTWQRTLNRLGGLHFMLKKKQKLTFSGSNQEAGRIFCKYFNIEMSNDSAFKPSHARTQAHHFKWITDF